MLLLLATLWTARRARYLYAPREWRINAADAVTEYRRTRRRYSEALVASIMQIVVSLVVLAAGLYVILSSSYVDEKKWGYSTVGAVIGYWLKR